jgi:glycosyltransferase involved in cell wall biosynthesis
MKKNGLVSIIIPVYNRKAMIVNAIKSIQNQTYTNYEILVVDDGSSDGTQKAVKAFNDSRITLIETDHNGAYIARNKGLKKARGKFIAFLDSDDIWLPEKLETQMILMTKEKNVAMSFTNGYIFKDKETEYEMDLRPTGKLNLPLKEFYKELLKNNFIATSSVVVRKDLLNNVGYFLSENRGCLDYQMWLRIAKTYEIRFLNKPLFIYNEHSKSLTGKRIARLNDQLYVYDLEEKWLLENGSKEDIRILHNSKSNIFKDLGMEFLHSRNQKMAKKFFIKVLKTGDRTIKTILKNLFWFFIPYSMFSIFERKNILQVFERILE